MQKSLDICLRDKWFKKDYDYKCVYNPKSFDYQKMTPKQMYHARLFDIIVYRITYTNVDGKVFEFSTQQVKEFCKKIQFAFS